MDYFIAADTVQGGAENTIALGVDQNFYQTLGLAALFGAPDLAHHHLADQGFAA